MVAYHHEPTSFGNVLATYDFTFEVQVKQGVDNWLLEGVIQRQAD